MEKCEQEVMDVRKFLPKIVEERGQQKHTQAKCGQGEHGQE